MSVIVCDLDGTLANIEHRLPLIKQEPKRWDEFFLACDKDEPNRWCVDLLMAMMAHGHKVKIVSCRSQIASDKTLAWLERVLPIKYSPGWELQLLRRPRDHRHDTVLKEYWLQEQRKEDILFVIEDRQKVVDMWRAHGLVCLQCYAWAEG